VPGGVCGVTHFGNAGVGIEREVDAVLEVVGKLDVHTFRRIKCQGDPMVSSGADFIFLLEFRGEERTGGWS
jgi:hypothetical protein